MKKYIAALHHHRFNGKLLLDPFEKYNILKDWSLIWRNKLVFMSSWVHMDLAKVACFFAISFKPDMPTETSITGACTIIILAITRASYKIDRKILKWKFR